MSELIIPSICLVGSPGIANETGCFLGGQPQLPAELAWPRTSDGLPLVHIAQILLDELPRSVAVAGQNLPLPIFPKTGTIFVFVSLADDDDNDPAKNPLQVLYTKQKLDHVLPQSPPKDAPVLGPRAPTRQLGPWYGLHLYAPEAMKIIAPPQSYPCVPLQIGTDVAVATEHQHGVHAQVGGTTFLPKIETETHYKKWKADCAERLPVSDYMLRRSAAKLIPYWLPNIGGYLSNNKTDGDGKPYHYSELPEGYPWRWIEIGRIVLFLWGKTAEAVERDAKRKAEIKDQLSKAKGTLKSRSINRIKGALGSHIPEPSKLTKKRDWHVAVTADFFGDTLPQVCRDWAEEVSRNDPFAEVGADRAEVFVNFLKDLDSRIPEVVRDRVEYPKKDGNGNVVEGESIVQFEARSTVSPDYDDGKANIALASMLSGAFFEGLNSAWPYVFNDGGQKTHSEDTLGYVAKKLPVSIHHMFGSGNSKPGSPTRVADEFSEMLLFLEIDTDETANMMWGDYGFLRLWIRPEHLAAGRFDQIKATFGDW